ncbi:MAG: hypothetical protein TYPL_4290 [Candidatus Tyloplasma litorale]|nr:MAG: hypothetical protein TYPL_4290 [Mycoplasmatales bacterium]
MFKKIGNFVNALDAKVDPVKGNKFRKLFKSLTLILIIVVLPIIAAIVGSFVCIQPDDFNYNAAAYGGFIPWFVLVFSSGMLWFYFSKWTVE